MMDIISKLPPAIIETILCLLPIQEAARTSILSREWRYHWVKIPKLSFIEDKFQVTTSRAELSVLEKTFQKPCKRKKMSKRCKLFYAIYQVLLIHEGPIHEFTLCVEADDSCVEIDHIILHLSKKNTVKILKLDFGWDYEWYMLPMSLFSLHRLTNMYLNFCALFHEHSFNEFGCLTTLKLKRLQTYEKTLVRLLSSCPVLKRLTLHCSDGDIIYSGSSQIVDLVKCLPVIEYLSILFTIVLSFGLERVPKEVPAAFVHLKYLCMKNMCFSHKRGLPFLCLLIRCSPNLEKLKLVNDDEDWLEEDDMGSITLEDYSDIMLERLNELEILNFSDTANQWDFLRLVLAKSPVLKKVKISPYNDFDEDGNSDISKILLSSICASPLVNFIFSR